MEVWAIIYNVCQFQIMSLCGSFLSQGNYLYCAILTFCQANINHMWICLIIHSLSCREQCHLTSTRDHLPL